MIDWDDILNTAISLTFLIGAIIFLFLYNKSLDASHNQIITINQLNEIQTNDCDKFGGAYISLDKTQGCLIFYPAYTNIKYDD